MTDGVTRGRGARHGVDGPFTNDVVDGGDLPRLPDDRFQPLDPAFLRLRTTATLVVGGVAAAIAATIVLADPRWPVFAAAAAIVAVVAGIGVARVVAARHMGYLVREHDLSFRSGVLSRVVATVPFARVQHVAIRRGPVDRAVGLASLQLRTAGGFVAIPGLHADLAPRLKELVADRAGVLADAEAAAADEEHDAVDHDIAERRAGDATGAGSPVRPDAMPLPPPGAHRDGTMP